MAGGEMSAISWLSADNSHRMSASVVKLGHFHNSAHRRRRDSLSADDLNAWIERHEVLGAGQWLSRTFDGTLRPCDRCLTFDGNLSCQRDIALPVLRRHGLTAFWFVCTAPLAGDIVTAELDEQFNDRHFSS